MTPWTEDNWAINKRTFGYPTARLVVDAAMMKVEEMKG